MTKWASCEKTEPRRPFKTNNRKQRDELQSDTEAETEPEPEPQTEPEVCQRAHVHLGQLRSRLATWAHCGRHFKNLRHDDNYATTRPKIPFRFSVFSLRFRLVSFRFFTFDLISSFLGRVGGGKVLFELFARWDTHRCDVFCNLFRIRSPFASELKTDRSKNSNNILSCSCANRD